MRKTINSAVVVASALSAFKPVQGSPRESRSDLERQHGGPPIIKSTIMGLALSAALASGAHAQYLGGPMAHFGATADYPTYFEWLRMTVAGALLDPVVRIPAVLIGYLVPRLWMRVAFVAIVGVAVSTFFVFFLRQAHAILPSDAIVVWIAASMGRGAVGSAIAEIIARTARSHH
jgi:hypothetical protein